MFKVSGAVATAALFISTFAALPAKATVSVRLINNGTIIGTVADGGAGDTNLIAGLLQTTISGTVGGSTTSATISAEGSPFTPMGTVGITNIQVSSGLAGTYQVLVTSTNQTAPVGPSFLTQDLSLTSLTAGTGSAVTVQGYEDNTNTAFGTSANTTGPLTPLTSIGSESRTSGPFTFSAPFSLTDIATITFGDGGGTANLLFTANLDSAAAVPEPTSILLLGTVLTGAGFALRKRAVRS